MLFISFRDVCYSLGFQILVDFHGLHSEQCLQQFLMRFLALKLSFQGVSLTTDVCVHLGSSWCCIFSNTNWCFSEHTVLEGYTGCTIQYEFTDHDYVWVSGCVRYVRMIAGNILVVLLHMYNCHFYIQYESTGHLAALTLILSLYDSHYSHYYDYYILLITQTCIFSLFF